MERRVMLKLDNIIKKLTDERKVDEKANKTTRLQVTAILSEAQAIKRRSGKLVTSSDSATGSIKRITDSVAALNRTLNMSGTPAGAGLGLQASADGGSGATDIFSGGAKQAPWVKGMVKDLRTDHVLNFLKPLSMADIMPNPAEKRMACASRLDRRFNFPGGVPEALTKLDTTILTPKKRKLGEEQEFKPEKLYKVLRQAWPRFQRDLEKVMVPAFMRRAGTLLEMGSVGRVDGRNNMPVFTRAEARRTVRGYWMLTTPVGRNSVLAGLHAGYQRLEALGIVMVEANDDTPRHYQVPYASYAAIVAMLYIAMHNKAGFPRFTGRGGNVDEAFRKVWASFMELLDDKLQKDNAANDGLMLTNGSDPMRAVFPGLSAERLQPTLDVLERAANPATQPPADDGSGSDSSDDDEDDGSNEDDEEDAGGMDD